MRFSFSVTFFPAAFFSRIAVHSGHVQGSGSASASGAAAAAAPVGAGAGAATGAIGCASCGCPADSSGAGAQSSSGSSAQRPAAAAAAADVAPPAERTAAPAVAGAEQPVGNRQLETQHSAVSDAFSDVQRALQEKERKMMRMSMLHYYKYTTEKQQRKADF